MVQNLASVSTFEPDGLSSEVWPCPSSGSKMFCAGPNFLSQPINLTTFSASLKTFVPAQQTILLNPNYLLVWHKKLDQHKTFWDL